MNAKVAYNKEDRLQEQEQPPEKICPKTRTTPGKIRGLQEGVRCGARTHDTQNHNLVLYQLN